MGVTFLTPWVLAAAAACAAAVVALHLLAVGPPPEGALPTARFVPARRARAMRRASRPSDVPLLLLRVLALLLAGAAFAGPRLVRERSAVAQLILVDRSRTVADRRAAMDTALRLARPGDLLIAFDSAAAAPIALGQRTIDSLRTAAQGWVAPTWRLPRGSLSAALAAAGRAAPGLRESADSLALVVVSPVADEELDGASERLRALWGGGATVVRVPPAAPAATAPTRVDVRSARADRSADVLLAAAELAGVRVGDGAVRVVRDGVRPADLAWVQDDPARVLVDWPESGVPAAWRPRERVDTVGAVLAGDVGHDDAGERALFVAALPRRALAPSDSGARAVAWWVDGTAAATETAAGAGCVRTVGIEVPQAGDAALDPSFARLLRALARPCGGALRLAQADVAWLAGPPALRPAREVAESGETRSALPAWLLACALALLAAEPLLRRARPVEVDA